MDIYDSLNRFIDKLITQSTPEAPIWNVEKLDGMIEISWNYIDGCMTSSLISLYRETKEEKYLDFLKKWTDHYVFEDGKIRGYDPTHYSTDDLSQSRILFDMYEFTKDEKFLKAIKHSFTQIEGHSRTNEGNFWHKKIYPYQVWLDGLYMMQPFYVRYEKMFNDGKNYDDTISQFQNVRRIMFDENKKLYYHCYDEARDLFWADPKTGLSPHFWLRAIGWYVAALADVAYYMDVPEHKAYLGSLLQEIIEGLLQYQDAETNMFWQIVDLGGKEKNYLETSGSLLIAYAMLKATNDGTLPETYRQIGLDIFESVCKHRLTEVDGDLNLEGICLVAGLGPADNLRRDGTYEYYMSEPIVKNDAKGVGPLIMAYTEALKAKRH
ncbi:MAG: glycoside hydrolase family 88 protein [Turicibacter sp.]|nr:glycoside hydrolase family 88 protein [Turicibacter sp.]